MKGADKDAKPPPRTFRTVQRGRPGQTARLVGAATLLPAAELPPPKPFASATPRPARDLSRLAGLGVALALHLVILGALVIVISPGAPLEKAEAASIPMVSLPRPPAPPPPPEIKEAPRPDEPVSRADPFPIKPRPVPDPPADIEPVSVPKPVPPPPAPPAPAPAPPVPAPVAPAPSPPASFVGEVMARIAQAKTYPPSSRARGEEGTVRVAFTLNRRGRVIDSAVVSSSGHSALDKEALATIERAQPFPTVPDDLAVPLALQVDIEFKLRK